MRTWVLQDANETTRYPGNLTTMRSSQERQAVFFAKTTVGTPELFTGVLHGA